MDGTPPQMPSPLPPHAAGGETSGEEASAGVLGYASPLAPSLPVDRRRVRRAMPWVVIGVALPVLTPLMLIFAFYLAWSGPVEPDWSRVGLFPLVTGCGSSVLLWWGCRTLGSPSTAGGWRSGEWAIDVWMWLCLFWMGFIVWESVGGGFSARSGVNDTAVRVFWSLTVGLLLICWCFCLAEVMHRCVNVAAAQWRGWGTRFMALRSMWQGIGMVATGVLLALHVVNGVRALSGIGFVIPFETWVVPLMLSVIYAMSVVTLVFLMQLSWNVVHGRWDQTSCVGPHSLTDGTR